MNDRLKFRAYISSTVCRDTEEEKEVGFYVYDVAVYSDGGVGFPRDNLIDALKKLDLTAAQRDEIEEDISENSYCQDYEWFSIEFGIVEQCTGLKDKNGKLIYEGDIVRVLEQYKTNTLDQVYPMLFNEKVAKFGFKSPEGHFFYYTNDEDFSYEIIGNIHENTDLWSGSNE